VLQFNAYWEGIHNGKASPKFIFDSRLTSYKQLSALNAAASNSSPASARQEAGPGHCKIKDWTKIHIPTRSGNTPTRRSMPRGQADGI